jgi:hypothetical protein
MTKLSPKKVQKILRQIKEGVLVSHIAQKYDVKTKVIYYHIYKQRKKEQSLEDDYWENREWQAQKIITKPTCYKDYLQNSVIRIEEKLRNNEYPSDNIPFVQSELRRIKTWIKIDRRHFPCSADIIQ